MPSYLLQDKQKREGKDPFQELFQLLANWQKDVDDHCIAWQNSDVYIKVVEGGVPDYLFCGHDTAVSAEV